jgi:sterol desaturase/sphingolipid hydroxylase (fatty acid hydroxylase superfamily)
MLKKVYEQQENNIISVMNSYVQDCLPINKTQVNTSDIIILLIFFSLVIFVVASQIKIWQFINSRNYKRPFKRKLLFSVTHIVLGGILLIIFFLLVNILGLCYKTLSN